MTFDINASPPSDQKVPAQTDERAAELTQELQALDHTLTGDLSTFTRADVVAMQERALAVQQALASRLDPGGAQRDDSRP